MKYSAGSNPHQKKCNKTECPSPIGCGRIQLRGSPVVLVTRLPTVNVVCPLTEWRDGWYIHFIGVRYGNSFGNRGLSTKPSSGTNTKLAGGCYISCASTASP